MPKGPLNMSAGGPDVVVDAGIAQYKEYEIIIHSEREFSLQHRDASLGIPAIQISLQ